MARHVCDGAQARDGAGAEAPGATPELAPGCARGARVGAELSVLRLVVKERFEELDPFG